MAGLIRELVMVRLLYCLRLYKEPSDNHRNARVLYYEHSPRGFYLNTVCKTVPIGQTLIRLIWIGPRRMRTAVYQSPDEEEHFRRYRFDHEKV